jgi:MoaA/NifB/PqqE/SkfB family radical SAM enzyme
VIRRGKEFSELGGRRFALLTGGNPLFQARLPEIITSFNSFGLHTSLSLSGPMIAERLIEWDEEWIGLPDLLLFSIDGDDQRHDAIKRVQGSYRAALAGLEVAKGRPEGSTHLSFIVIPGEQGNINLIQFTSVLKLAEETRTMINPFLLFGGDFSGKKERFDMLWSNVTDQEERLLTWFFRQDRVLKQAQAKLDFLRGGGNNRKETHCGAGTTVLSFTTSDSLEQPCPHNINRTVPIIGTVKETLDSAEWQKCLNQAGDQEGCENCHVWCNDVTGILKNPHFTVEDYCGM